MKKKYIVIHNPESSYDCYVRGFDTLDEAKFDYTDASYENPIIAKNLFAEVITDEDKSQDKP